MNPPDLRGGSLYGAAVEAFTDLYTQTGQVPTLCDVATRIEAETEELRAMFPGREDLLAAMAENAMMLLQDQCIQTVVAADGNDPLAQFEALGDAYLEWAYRHPREFRIIGMMPGDKFERSEVLTRYEHGVHEMMLKLLRRAQAMGMLDESEDLQVTLAVFHTYAYGVASKMLVGDLQRWMPGADPLGTARMAMRAFSRMVVPAHHT
ncbi:MAG: WHG domain-containing protein [Paracoccus sp. (in: a-proteobacteria)]|uniref:TetR/AcrR family transcriptional regulator n=1 Tax=Paracoccus sp. TaxID=267 RepID=UPI0039E6B332